MPMGQGGQTYKAMSQQSKYFLQMMEQSEENSINYAESYGGLDGNEGFVKNYLAAAVDAADDQGQAIKMQAVQYAVSAGIGVVGMGLTAFKAGQTRTGALDEQLDDAKLMQKDLNAPPKLNLVQEENDDAPGAALPAPSQEVEQKLNAWKEQGNDAFKNYKAKRVSLDDAQKVEADRADKLNEDAVEHAKLSESKKDIARNLDDYIKDLNAQKGELTNQFTQFTNMLNAFMPTVTQGVQTPFKFEEAGYTSRSQTEQAEAGVVQTIQQKQGGFIDAAQQQQSQYQQAADSVASGYGQVAQTRG